MRSFSRQIKNFGKSGDMEALGFILPVTHLPQKDFPFLEFLETHSRSLQKPIKISNPVRPRKGFLKAQSAGYIKNLAGPFRASVPECR
jgi:hypothetical protein